MRDLARWCYRHRYLVVGAWVVALLAVAAASMSAGSSYSNAFGLANTESAQAQRLLQSALPQQAGDADEIVVHVDSGTVRDPAVQQKVTAMLGEVEGLSSVNAVSSMYDARGSTGQISQDGRTAYATVQFDAPASDLDVADIQAVIDTAQKARTDGLAVELGGQAIGQAEMTTPSSSELIGIGAAAIILFVAFGSLLGMLLPLLVAVAGLGGGLLSIGLVSHAVSMSDVAPTLAALIGLGVGIDYALFIVTRHRAGLDSGLSTEEALVRAMDTSGRAVLFAGGTVVTALLGLLVLNVDFLSGLGIGSAVAVIWTMVAAVTLLPALLGVLGPRLLPRRARRALQHAATDMPSAVRSPDRTPASGGVWARWAGFVAQRKVVLSVIALAIIAILATPMLSLRLGSSDDGNGVKGTTTREAYDLLAAGFGPGSNGPLQLVAELKAPADAQALTDLVSTLRTTDGVASVNPAPLAPNADVGIVEVVPTSAPQDAATSNLISHIRDTLVPEAETGTSLQVYVGGPTATFGDFATVLTNKLPLFLTVIIGLGFLLLLLAFRSLLVPLTAAAMNVLAAAASFGVVVAVFQWGWGTDLLPAIGKAGPVEAFLPVIMLAVLFGLSMDYQVFLVSRMHEEWEHTHDNHRAVIAGQAVTGRIITAAALIMMSVFTAFIFGGERVIAEFGIGLAAAVAIDAFVIRTVLVPSLMHLAGPANWWIPTWLDKHLPHLSIEPGDDHSTVVTNDETASPLPVSR